MLRVRLAHRVRQVRQEQRVLPVSAALPARQEVQEVRVGLEHQEQVALPAPPASREQQAQAELLAHLGRLVLLEDQVARVHPVRPVPLDFPERQAQQGFRVHRARRAQRARLV